MKEVNKYGLNYEDSIKENIRKVVLMLLPKADYRDDSYMVKIIKTYGWQKDIELIRVIADTIRNGDAHRVYSVMKIAIMLELHRGGEPMRQLMEKSIRDNLIGSRDIMFVDMAIEHVMDKKPEIENELIASLVDEPEQIMRECAIDKMKEVGKLEHYEKRILAMCRTERDSQRKSNIIESLENIDEAIENQRWEL